MEATRFPPGGSARRQLLAIGATDKAILQSRVNDGLSTALQYTIM